MSSKMIPGRERPKDVCQFGVPFDKNGHPTWFQPVPSTATAAPVAPGLRVNNSLTGEKEEFVPLEGNKVKWYTCGPTVYDACHMGHARAYLTMDILRRIMEDYFNFEVFLQVNVTDVDDKIIQRARRNKLVDDYAGAGHALAAVKAKVGDAVGAFAAKQAKKLAKLEIPLTARREEDERVELLEQHKQKMANFAEAKAKIDAALATSDGEAIVRAASEPLAEALDAELGESVTDHEIFNAHSRRFEAEFMEDMTALGIRPPDSLTRVTEYVPQIVTFVEQLVAKGLAYASNGSVYMDISKMRACGHAYPKLEPSKGKATEAEMAESEGTFTAEAGEKRNATDFAVWKKSKGGEPSWPSPWGGGRPGWHIECSVMATDLMGDNMDVHAGGYDLKFPHHDNEIAQSEAYHGCKQWVNYFFHFGHLHIKGLKMSKSLKNFITIRQALAGHTARQIRLMFLLAPWDKPMNYSDQTIDEAKAREKTLLNYFGRVKAEMRREWLARPTSWGEVEREMNEKITDAQGKVHAALLDNFDTPTAMAELLAIVADANTYLAEREAAGGAPDVLLLRRGAIYITKMLRVFGVATQDEFGLPLGAEGGDYEARVAPMLDAIVGFRDAVRAAARGGAKDGPAAFDGLLKLCDELRDSTMVELGVRVEDRAEGSLWKLDDPATLRAEVAEKLAAKAEQAAAKALNRLKERAEKVVKAEAAAVPPAELLKRPPHAAKYSAFDDNGKPTKDAAGADLSKAESKNADKMIQKQAKEHEKHLAALAKTPNMLAALRADVDKQRAEVHALLADAATAAHVPAELLAQMREAAGDAPPPAAAPSTDVAALAPAALAELLASFALDDAAKLLADVPPAAKAAAAKALGAAATK